jgi:hypothetical protein
VHAFYAQSEVRGDGSVAWGFHTPTPPWSLFWQNEGAGRGRRASRARVGRVSGFVRPEVRAALWRWREALAGATLVVIGLWMVWGPGLLLALPGYAAMAAGIALVWLGVQRARFRGRDDGAGAVQVDEGQVTYFGPLSGGSVALRELERLSLDREMFPAHWRLEQKGQVDLLIPVDALGSEALFDAFATLPGLRTERMLFELRKSRHGSVVIWERVPMRPAQSLLH